MALQKCTGQQDNTHRQDTHTHAHAHLHPHTGTNMFKVQEMQMTNIESMTHISETHTTNKPNFTVHYEKFYGYLDY